MSVNLLPSYPASTLSEERLARQTVVVSAALLCHCEEPRRIGATKQSRGVMRLTRGVYSFDFAQDKPK